MAQQTHRFRAVAFVENFNLRECAAAFESPRLLAYELQARCGAGDVFAYAFGAVVFRNVDAADAAAQLQRFRECMPSLTQQVVEEEFSVHEDAAAAIGISSGVFRIDKMTTQRAGVIALTVAQSAAMEYYEKLVDGLFVRTKSLLDRLENTGTVSMRTRPLHKFIGRAIGTRTEIIAILHLLDKPDATWDDPAMSDIYDDLRAEFDLIDRYSALESKLKGIQDGLEIVLDVARDNRLVFLEASIVALIVLEIVLTLSRVV